MSHSVRRAVSVSLFTALVLSGCSNDTPNDTPTAAEAGETLKVHIMEILRRVDARDVTVTDPGGRNIPCGEGIAKQTYGATGKDTFETREPSILNVVMFGKLDYVAPYRLVEDRGAHYIKVANDDLKTTITLNSTIKGQYSITGETQCLRIGD